MDKLLDVLNTPSEAVQRAVSDCLSPLMPAKQVRDAIDQDHDKFNCLVSFKVAPPTEGCLVVVYSLLYFVVFFPLA